MLTGALFYLISSHLELVSSLCQRCDGAVNKNVWRVEEGGWRRGDSSRDRGRRRAIETAVPVAFKKYKGFNQDVSSNLPGPVALLQSFPL